MASQYPLSILHVVYECEPGHHRGGVQKVVYELARAQGALGHRVVIATLESGRGSGNSDVEHGVTIRRFPFTPGLRRRYSFALGSSFRRGTEQFDIVHTHNSFSPLNWTARRLARRWGAGLFVHPHGALDPLLVTGSSPKHLRKRLYLRLVERPTLNAAAAVFALNDNELAWLHGLGIRAPVYVVPNGVDPIAPASPAATTRFQREHQLEAGPVLLYVGRFVPKKNLEFILEATATLLAELPTLVLVLCGDRQTDPPYTAVLDEIVRDLGLCGVVRWVGFLDEEEKASAYDCSDLFLHASYSEGKPMAVLEAMSAGLPCLVTPGTMMGDAALLGAVLERGTLGSYVAAAMEVLSDQSLAESVRSASRRIVADAYSWKRVASEISGHYQRS